MLTDSANQRCYRDLQALARTREGVTGDEPARAGPAAGDAAANRGGKLTRDMVLAAALEIVDRDGADALSMRRLAAALNRDPMILYRHASNKAAVVCSPWREDRVMAVLVRQWQAGGMNAFLICPRLRTGSWGLWPLTPVP
jgi:AcrR family transcriptional regulator